MIAGSVRAGRGDAGAMAYGGVPVIWKVIVSKPLVALASRIACLNEPGPPSKVLVTVRIALRP